jgi:hypothetical protein
LTEQRESSGRRISEIVDWLKALFGEYDKSLNEFGVRPAPQPSNLGIPEFMDWINAEFKAIPEVIFGANDFAAAFSVESILKLLHDFDSTDLAKFRKKLSQFPDALSTSRIRPNEDVQVIKSKFAREFWLASGKEAVKSIVHAKLAQVDFRTILLATIYSQDFCPLIFLTFVSSLLLVDRGRESWRRCCIP